MEQSVKEKVLVVQDNEIFQDVISQKLSDAGYRVVHAETSLTLNHLRDIKPDVVVIDVVSPKEKGLTFVENMKKQNDLKDIPVIGLVKTEDSVIAVHAKELGVAYVIDKIVFQANDLIDKIKKSVSKQTTAQEGPSTTQETSPVAGSARPKPAEEPSQENSKADRVLLVEDDQFMREMFKQSLIDAGFDTQAAEDAEVGLKILQDGFVPHVVLLDLLLPGKSGFEFLSEVRKQKEFKLLPIVVISNLGNKGDIDRAMEFGASDFLIKANSTIDEIIKKTKEYIEKGKRGPRNLPESMS